MNKAAKDLAIARSVTMRPIADVARDLGLDEADLTPYGRHMAKVSLAALPRLEGRPLGKYVVVTAINPTPLGEGKTVTTIGLGLGLNQLGKRATVCLRQPSLGPVFGIKGGAAGGGRSQVVPMEEFNLHFTGDVHAVGTAHNLLAAFIDNHLHHGNALDLVPHSISWPRVVDISDRALRAIVTGLRHECWPRETRFDVTVASEVMAILALTRDIPDLRRRLARILVGLKKGGGAVTAGDLGCSGAMAVLLKDAIHPNLIQTLEGGPCFVHAGPFANIAHGNSSILADRIALRCSEYVVTESGFGADMGFEKFCDIKCRASGLAPDAAVVVCSVRALKMHAGGFKITPGRPLDARLTSENLPALEAGIPNLLKHLENIREFGVPAVVAVNRFPTDTDRELEFVRAAARAAGVEDAVVSEVFEHGGAGGRALAEAVTRAAARPSAFKFLYPLEAPTVEKIRTIATRIYGAKDIELSPEAKKQLKLYEGLGLGGGPVCMAKTHLSLSHDPALKGRPRDFVVPVREVRAYAGAGFLTPVLGEIGMMPGLPSAPNALGMDLDDAGQVVGLA
ncbi:MAG: formate--tetrahydrofolate ligase [Planctomycetes bacterium]|nr:formate--tetrahydrofolate ligase [Planctomycetota bacterium]